MRSMLRSFFWDHSPGVRWLLLVFGVSYLVAAGPSRINRLEV